ncbi:MAG TPA: hypothetical protein VNO75_03140 [Gemmatimonadaceae bacterium]|nr:hypothetical protein [Gemmatimonadaceae bacterium]
MKAARISWHRTLCVALLGGGCSGTDRMGPSGFQDPLPANLVFVAQAAGIYRDNLWVDCGIDTYMTLDSRIERGTAHLTQFGTGGGDARRYVDKPNGTAIAFWAHTVFADLRIDLIGRDSIEIRSPESANATERFWREFAVFAGNTRDPDLAAGVLARGTWTCQPMDTPPSSGEYHDVEGTASGTWVLRRDIVP